MKNIEQIIGTHRRKIGFGKTQGGDVGTFELPLGGTRYTGGRWAICKVYRGEGVEMLSVTVRSRKDGGSKRAMRRRPTMDEVEAILPFFFHDHEIPVQFHPKADKNLKEAPIQFWLGATHYNQYTPTYEYQLIQTY